MSFKEELKVAGKKLHVLGSYALKQGTDTTSRPFFITHCGKNIARDGIPITETFTLRAKEISVGSELHVNEWV